MSKRKQDEDDETPPELVDVNFDYYNVNADNDYHAIQRLFIQLFGPDAERVQIGPLTDLVSRVAEENGVGSTIKTEEETDSDPYAVLTAISCRDHPGLQDVISYVLSKSDKTFNDTLTSALQNGHVGLVFSERLINMPVQVMGPMYKMLADEIEDAIEDGRDYTFTHFLFVSRVYRLSPEEDERHAKRSKSAHPNSDGVYGFHPEDDEIVQHATNTVTYAFTDQAAPTVGLDIAGRAMLVPAESFKSLVARISDNYRI